MTRSNSMLQRFFILLSLITITVTKVHAQWNTAGSRAMADMRSQQRMMQAYKDGRANGRQMRGYLGYDVGVSFAFADRDLSCTYHDLVNNSIDNGPVVLRKKLKRRGYYLAAGSYIPLGNLTESSCLAFSWGVAALLLDDNTSDMNPVTGPSGHIYKGGDIDILYYQFGVPLSLDFKYGGEAVYDKSQAFSLTLGAGLQPSVLIAGPVDAVKTSASLNPMLKAELGFFLGIEWKVKLNYIYQSGTVYTAMANYNGKEWIGTTKEYAMTTKPTLTLGISFMPFSHDWEISRW